ncbi:putative pentatricopeptide repeat-containing protein At5g43820 [Cornus florida]|uniref:putative pentatricopeptide repeat-containing protein At5g43820 n=1 Tax=Cornus florida TaxID=4283 RepID=UPI00289D29A2|nr:putative pentatricopeptide repeat-containing protein At5g43820 [Cornus florida]XP_059660252.1 putative pentatricopeptide repeat-containing protein At5g43820 [Cornus florida]XP_059660253.1 putative pentatricopeptide repeat-containing protein At5g43820 [Cornus florida]XP_059660254.1 putative pentatricopeptide repeat-containing protein At5g43820 [Cornus florida]
MAMKAMACRSQRFLTAQFEIIRYISSYTQSSFPSTTPDPLRESPSSSSENQSSIITIDESHVLDQLSHLLPIRRRSEAAIPNPHGESSIRPAVDGFLPPEEKLRGVFLQKLRGKTAIESALKNVGVELSTDVVAKVVDRGNLSGEAMVMFFKWAIRQPEISDDIGNYHKILKALGRRKFFTYMVDLLHDMKLEGIAINSETLFIVVDSFIRAHQLSKAVKFFGQLEEFGSRCDTESLNVLLQCLCQRSRVGVANSFLNKMKGKIPFNRATYNVIISGWSRFGNVSEIERCLKAMVTDGFDPDNSTFSYLIEGLGRAGQIDDAVEIFENLGEKGCGSDAGVYNALISNFISVGDFDECMKYYERMQSNKCDPNVHTYTILISAFLKVRKVADAIEIFDEMLGRGIIPTTGTITSFIEPLCSNGPPHAAMMIYKKARKVGCRISLSAYKLLFKRLSRFGKCGMMLGLLDEMQESGYSSDVNIYEHVIHGLCNIGQLENAILVMEESLRKGFCPSRLTCNKLNNRLLNSNKVEKAYKLHLKIKDARRNENARKYWRAKGWHF